MEEETIITHLLGKSPKIKVLELLIIGRRLEYCISDMAEHAGVGRTSIYRMLDAMLKDHVLVKRRKLGRIQLYQLNDKNPQVKILIKMFDEFSKIASEQEIEKQAISVKAKH